MTKRILVLIKSFLIFFIFLSNLAFANHKDGREKIVSVNMDLDKNAVRIKYCAKTATEKKDKTDKQGPLTEEELKELATVKKKWKIKNYHDPKGQSFSEIIPLKKKPPYDINEETKLKKVLDTLCIHRAKEEISLKTDTELYLKIAEANDIKNKKGNFSYKESIGSEVYENGIKVPEDVEEVIIHTPDYLIKETEAVKKQIAEETKAIQAKEKEQKYLEKNRPEVLKKAKAKKAESDVLIEKLKKNLAEAQGKLKGLEEIYVNVSKAIQKLFDLGIQNKSDKEISELYNDLYDKKEEYFSNKKKIEKFQKEIKEIQDNFDKLKKSSDYKIILNIIDGIQKTNSKKKLIAYKTQLSSVNAVDTITINKSLEEVSKEITEYTKEVEEIDELRTKTLELDETLGTGINFSTLAIYIFGFLIVVGIGAYIYIQNKKISSLSSATKSAGKKFSELEGQLKSTSDQIRSVASRREETRKTPRGTQPIPEKAKTSEEIIASKFDELTSDYNDVLDNFSKVAGFKQKWSGLALSRKERQDGSKTILINSSRAFEKAEIWCVNFSGKYFAFPGSSVKTNMATYMNLDFEKAQRDFKGVFYISSGSNYSTEPCVLRRGGAGFVVERIGKLTFPQ